MKKYFVSFDTLNPICINIVSYSRITLLWSFIRMLQFDTYIDFATFRTLNLYIKKEILMIYETFWFVG